MRCIRMFFFFFQAEDGIRDKLVTGVQTCALPISKAESRLAGAAMLVLAAVCAVMMFPVTAPLWRWLPELRFVQFAWRWAGLLGVSMAYFLAAVAARKRLRGVVAVFLLAIYPEAGQVL